MKGYILPLGFSLFSPFFFFFLHKRLLHARPLCSIDWDSHSLAPFWEHDESPNSDPLMEMDLEDVSKGDFFILDFFALFMHKHVAKSLQSPSCAPRDLL